MKNENVAVAGFWKRTLAFIFDLLIINVIIIWPFQKLFSNLLPKNLSSELMMSSPLPSSVYLMIFVIFVLAMLYFMFFEYYLGQSMGQMFFDIKIVSMNANNDVTMWQSLLRNCFILPIFPFYILWIVEPLYLIIYKQRLTEKLTGTNTVVVSRNQGYLHEYKLSKV